MGVGIGDLLWVFLLFTNAVAILSEERFLARIGWSSASTGITAPVNAYDSYGGAVDPMGGPAPPGLKAKLINLIGAVRTLMRIPLIILNLFVIGWELALG